MTSDQYGAGFLVVVFFACVVNMFQRPKETLIVAIGAAVVGAIPYGIWCLAGWNGIMAYNAYMTTALLAFFVTNKR